jgi:hypothetical protein
VSIWVYFIKINILSSSCSLIIVTKLKAECKYTRLPFYRFTSLKKKQKPNRIYLLFEDLSLHKILISCVKARYLHFLSEDGKAAM